MRAVTKKRFYLVTTAVFVITIVIAVITFIGIRFVNANDDSNISKYKYYTSYKIQQDDTLTSIAEKYTKDTNVSVSDYISDLKNDNRLKDDEITEGENLIITYYSDVKKWFLNIISLLLRFKHIVSYYLLPFFLI